MKSIQSNQVSSKRNNAGYAEPKESDPRLGLLDDFDGDPDGYPHGQAVESVLLSHSKLSDEDIQRFQNEPELAELQKEISRHGDFRTAFRSTVAKNVGKFYLSTTLNLHQILREQSGIKVISQSQGETSANQLEQVYQGLSDSPDFRQRVAQAMGLPADASVGQVCQTLLNEADEVANNAEICQQARQVYLKAAKEVYDRGITYLVAAGNHGPLSRELLALGAETSPSAFRNILVNEYVTVVGANDAQGKPSGINSPNSGAEVYELGEGLAWSTDEGFIPNQGVDSGTSLATPIVAARVLAMLEENPQLTPFQIESLLKGETAYQLRQGQTVTTANKQILEADGELEPYILGRIGEGFVTGIFGDEAAQLARATQPRTFFGLPGTEDHEFQLVRVSPDPDGRRELSVSTYFDEGYHVLKAHLKGNRWDPESVVEELHLDPVREAQIRANQKKR